MTTTTPAKTTLFRQSHSMAHVDFPHAGAGGCKGIIHDRVSEQHARSLALSDDQRFRTVNAFQPVESLGQHQAHSLVPSKRCCCFFAVCTAFGTLLGWGSRHVKKKKKQTCLGSLQVLAPRSRSAEQMARELCTPPAASRHAFAFRARHPNRTSGSTRKWDTLPIKPKPEVCQSRFSAEMRGLKGKPQGDQPFWGSQVNPPNKFDTCPNCVRWTQTGSVSRVVHARCFGLISGTRTTRRA